MVIKAAEVIGSDNAARFIQVNALLYEFAPTLVAYGLTRSHAHIAHRA